MAPGPGYLVTTSNRVPRRPPSRAHTAASLPDSPVASPLALHPGPSFRATPWPPVFAGPPCPPYRAPPSPPVPASPGVLPPGLYPVPFTFGLPVGPRAGLYSGVPRPGLPRGPCRGHLSPLGPASSVPSPRSPTLFPRLHLPLGLPRVGRAGGGRTRPISHPMCSTMASYSRGRNARHSSSALTVRTVGVHGM